MKKIFIYLILSLSGYGMVSQSSPPKTDSLILSSEKNSLSVSKISFSGYIQTQFQYGDEFASLKVGGPNENLDGEGFSRIGIRRGRVKLTYSEKLISTVVQLDITEKGVGFKDAYLQIKDPWKGVLSLRAGMFDRPFGYEIEYSSSRRESPERTLLFQTLFPDERDLGFMLTFQWPKTHQLHFLKLDAGLISGNGIKIDTDSKKDFITRLSASKNFHAFDFGIGASYYYGQVYNLSRYTNTMVDNAFQTDSVSTAGHYHKRQYAGIDAQLNFTSTIGKTSLKAEYILGQQPGFAESSKSPNYTKNEDIQGRTRYIRPFSGFYACLVHDLVNTPLALVLKYDRYDPNTLIKGDPIGKAGTKTNATDLAYNTFGFGCLWRISASLRLQAFYEIVKNETTDNIELYQKDVKDNVFTLRLQYKF